MITVYLNDDNWRIKTNKNTVLKLIKVQVHSMISPVHAILTPTFILIGFVVFYSATSPSGPGPLH